MLILRIPMPTNLSLDVEGKQLKKSGNADQGLVKLSVLLIVELTVMLTKLVKEFLPLARKKSAVLKPVCYMLHGKCQKNAHAHFILGLMYQRMGQPQKAVLSYEKAAEILLRCEEEIDRPDFLALVQIHHAQCLLPGSSEDISSDKELEDEELQEILSKLKESMKCDIRRASVWNTLGIILLKSGRLQNDIVSDTILLLEKCFQDLILKDQNHPSALINYAAVVLCKYGSVVAGAGANAEEGAYEDQVSSANVAKECLLAAVKADPKAAHIWLNLALPDSSFSVGRKLI